MSERVEESAPDLREGTISRVAQQKRNAERVSVFIDERFAFGLALDLALEAGLRKGLCLTVAEQEALLAREGRHRAYAAALDYLSYGAKTATEVRRKLRQKGHEEAAIEEAIGKMEEYGYLDDEAYARAYVRGRFAGRGYGPERLRQELLRRGVARPTVDLVLDELTEAEDLDEAAERHARKRWQALFRETDDRKRRKKTIDFLLRRGFSYDIAQRTVEAIAREEGE